jgi:hypothetical protein
MSLKTKDGSPVEQFKALGGFGSFEDNFSDLEQYYPDIEKVYKRVKDKSEGVFAEAGYKIVVLGGMMGGMLMRYTLSLASIKDFLLLIIYFLSEVCYQKHLLFEKYLAVVHQLYSLAFFPGLACEIQGQPTVHRHRYDQSLAICQPLACRSMKSSLHSAYLLWLHR